MVIFNTLTQQKEKFDPLEPNLVQMYVCGVTVYDDCHLGHARSAIVFDVIRRYLIHRGYEVRYVKNFTDVDDKILKRSEAEGIPWTEVTKKYIQSYLQDMERLGVTSPDVEPRATDHMTKIIEVISGLVDKGYAYRMNGDVYYEVATYKPYGQLSGRNLEELLAGARVDVDERKKDPMDFALWKGAKPGEPYWDSPWGPGRPGWHIECSAMSMQYLGNTFDIHGGGKDLIFPHHENERAQSCALTGQEFARYWLHNGFVTIDEAKMSKSLGNFFTVRDIFKQSNCPESVTAETLRYFLLSTHYRSDLNFSNQAVSESKAALDNIYGLMQRLEEDGKESDKQNNALEMIIGEFTRNYEEAMDDDFNTPKAVAELQKLRGKVNGLLKDGLSRQNSEKAVHVFQKFGEPLGLLGLSPRDWVFRPLLFSPQSKDFDDAGMITEEFVEQQIRERLDARKRKDFATADQIREALASRGIVIEDRPDGTTRWKR